MKILLIKPRWFVAHDGYKYKHRVAPLNLGIIAALSGDHSIKIIDEDVEKIEYSDDWDLVGITAATFTSKKAYDISENFRSLGVTTVLGGIHPSLMPEEALKHCDSVLIGEAERAWPKLLEDFQNQSLKKTYQNIEPIDLSEVPFPRRDLLPTAKEYFHDMIQATRGCTHSCRYCYLQSVPWGQFRKRPIQNVYNEIARIKNRYLYFMDDNLFADIDYAKQLFEKIIPLKKCWGVQAPTTIAKDKELLKLMRKAGCYVAALGFQSVNQNTLDAASVKQNRSSEYKQIIKTLHDHNIFVAGFFMFGFDTDDNTVFKYTVDMIKELEIDESVLYILTPYPGTKLFDQFNEENRILNKDWSKYSWYNVNFQPKRMTPFELKQGLHESYIELNRFFKRNTGKMFWKYKKWFFKDPKITLYLVKNYFNYPDISKLP